MSSNVDWRPRTGESDAQWIKRLKGSDHGGFAFAAAWHEWCIREDGANGIPAHRSRGDPSARDGPFIRRFMDTWRDAGFSVRKWAWDQRIDINWERENAQAEGRQRRTAQKGKGHDDGGKGKGKGKDDDKGRGKRAFPDPDPARATRGRY